MFKLGNKDILSRLSGNVKPSALKFNDPDNNRNKKTTHQYRTRETVTPGTIKSIGSAPAGRDYTEDHYERWGTQYLYTLKNMGLLDEYMKKYPNSNVGKDNQMQIRFNQALSFMRSLSPEQQWDHQESLYRTYYPDKYDKWIKANPKITTRIKERKSTTTTPGSKGTFEYVWDNMPEEEKSQYDSFDSWKEAALRWNEEKGTPDTVEEGEWEEISRDVIRGT